MGRGSERKEDRTLLGFLEGINGRQKKSDWRFDNLLSLGEEWLQKKRLQQKTDRCVGERLDCRVFRACFCARVELHALPCHPHRASQNLLEHALVGVLLQVPVSVAGLGQSSCEEALDRAEFNEAGPIRIEGVSNWGPLGGFLNNHDAHARSCAG